MNVKCNRNRNCKKEIAVGLLSFAAGLAAAKLFCRVKKKKEKLRRKCDDYMSSFNEHTCNEHTCNEHMHNEPTCNDDACDINYNVTTDIPNDKGCDDTDISEE